jgi:hypothetical protein
MKVRLLHDLSKDDKDSDYLLGESSRRNEQLAFMCGLSCLMAYMADNEGVKKTLENNNFILPKATNKNDPNYANSMIRTLYYSNTLSGFNTLLLSNIFFLLEAYHKKSCSIDT